MADLVPILPSELEELPAVTGTETIVTFNEQEEYNRTTISEVENHFQENLNPRLTEIEGKIVNSLATQLAAGLMSAFDKTKLDDLITTAATQVAMGYMSAGDKIKLDALITELATQTTSGYMSASDKTKLDGLDDKVDILGNGAKLVMLRFLADNYPQAGAVTPTIQYCSKADLISSITASAGSGGTDKHIFFTINFNTSIGRPVKSVGAVLASIGYQQLANGDGAFGIGGISVGDASASITAFAMNSSSGDSTRRSVALTVLIAYIPA